MMTNDCILQKCQDFSKHLMESGSSFSFRVSIWNGISFSLSSRGPPPPMTRTFPTPGANKKTPSMRRRDQRRWEDFQAKKSQTFSDSPVTGSQPPATDSRQEAKVSKVLPAGIPNSAVRPAPKSENPNFGTKRSPAPSKMEVDNPTSEFNDTKDIQLVFCAPNQTAAKIQAKKNFAKSTFEPNIENG